jgi:pimeloyl-ACP methyl ester carboxylesterase
VVAPALVLHYRADRLIPFRGGQQLAAGLPDARFVALEGSYHLPDAHDLDTVANAVVAFLSQPELS